MARVTKLSDIKISDIKFSSVVPNKKGGKAIYLNDANGGKLTIRLPPMKAIVGVSPYYNDKSDKKSIQNYKMPLAVNDPAVVTFLKALDKAVLDHIKTHEGQFFNKKTLKDMMVNYKPFLQEPEAGKGYAPLLKTNIIWSKETDTFGTDFYDEKGADINPIDLIGKNGREVTALVQLTSIYNTPVGFGLSIRLVQAKVASVAEMPKRALVDDPVEEEEYEEEDEE
jgi:hypothetical protein